MTTRIHVSLTTYGCALLAWLVVACGSEPHKQPERPETAASSRPPSRPNVLLVTLDTTRADRIGTYGFKLARTPNLDRLAREGVRAVHATASAPITAPSHASMLSGLYPIAHGVRDNGSYRLADDIKTLPEALREHGYETRAFVSALVLHHRYNLSQGFEVYDDALWGEDAPKMFMIRERPGARTVDRMVAWLDERQEKRKDQPFFAWVHLFDVHQPHEPTSVDRVMTPTLYDAEIAGVDRQVGRMLDALAQRGVLDDTLVIVTADHGESLGEHGEETHAVFVYEATIHVPLLFRFPKALPARTEYTGTARGIDLAPTVLSALSLPSLENIDGKSLWGALTGASQPLREPAYSESLLSELGFGMAPLYAVRDGDLTYVRAPRPELYDRATDPRELRDLSRERPDVLKRMDELLSRVMSDSEKHGHRSPVNPLDQETIEGLQALGYLAPVEERKAMAGMDPKDGIVIYEKTQQLRHLTRMERFEDCLKLGADLLKKTPTNISVLGVLAQCQTRLGKHGDARKTLAKAMEVDPGLARMRLQLAYIDMKEGKLDDAVKQLDRALELSPGFVEAVTTRGTVEILRKNFDLAEQYYQRAIAADPSFPRAYQVYGDLNFRRKDWQGALTYYDKALAVLPDNFAALVQAGVAAQNLKDWGRALDYHARAEKLRPDSWQPPYNQACIAALRGDQALALSRLEHAVSLGIPTRFAVSADPDLSSLHALPGYAELLQRLDKERKAREERPKQAGSARL